MKTLKIPTETHQRLTQIKTNYKLATLHEAIDLVIDISFDEVFIHNTKILIKKTTNIDNKNKHAPTLATSRVVKTSVCSKRSHL